ncbi:hypothetical protein V2G26_020325 [Clonostachys chloroleuca]
MITPPLPNLDPPATHSIHCFCQSTFSRPPRPGLHPFISFSNLFLYYIPITNHIHPIRESRLQRCFRLRRAPTYRTTSPSLRLPVYSFPGIAS